jgi:hypothetical protein
VVAVEDMMNTGRGRGYSGRPESNEKIAIVKERVSRKMGYKTFQHSWEGYSAWKECA